MKLAHVTINVENMEESLKFYEEVVGLPISLRFPTGENSEIVFLGQGESKVELIKTEEDIKPNIGGDIAIGFGVEDLDKTMEHIKEKGISIDSGPIQASPTTRFFFVLDPNGLRVQFIEQK